MTDKQLGQTANTTPDRPLTVEELVKPWANFHGDLPDYDHPLRCVYESGIQYAVDLLATELKVKEYDICDGTEEFDGDLGGTLMNIVRAALPADEYGEPMWPSEVQKALTDRYAQGRADVLAEVRAFGMGANVPVFIAEAIERNGPKNLVSEEIEGLKAALRKWKCPSCGGKKTYPQRYWADGDTGPTVNIIPCKVCGETGLHPIARQALAPNPAPVEEWQPIETAPRDGSEFLGYHLCNDGYTGDWFALIDYSGDAEWPWEDGEGKHPEGFLTHWRPLPAPPRTRATEILAGNAKKEGE